MADQRFQFSVIIPTLNRGQQLGCCLRALAEMDYPRESFEIIVVDDGSIPPVPDRIGEGGGGLEIRWLRLGENCGPAAARNVGAAAGRGRYLAFLDDDCLASRQWLGKLEEALEAAPRSAAGGRVESARLQNVYAEANQAILSAVYRYYNADPDNARFFASMNFAVPAGLFRELGGFDPAFRASEDREFCARWRKRGLRLVYAAGAVVLHHPVLGWGEFWKRHYRFGQGAYHFRKRHTATASGRVRLEPARFYRDLVMAPLRAGFSPRAGQAAALIAVSQLASALGFWVASRRHLPATQVAWKR